MKLSKSLSLRQQVLATAQVYIRRFYIKVDFRQTNPFLILATALYLACKMEESPQHIRAVVQEGRRMWSGKSKCPLFVLSHHPNPPFIPEY